MKNNKWAVGLPGIIVLLLIVSIPGGNAAAAVLWESGFETSPDDDWDFVYATGTGAVSYDASAAYSGARGSDSYVAMDSGEAICRGGANIGTFISERHVRAMINVSQFVIPDGGRLAVMRDVGSSTQVYLLGSGSDYQLRLRAFWDGGNEYSAPVTIDKVAWHQVDLYIRNETSLGSGDGVVMWWIDGVLYYSKTDCAAIEDTDAWVFGIANSVEGDASEYGHIYVDDVKVLDSLTTPTTGGAPVISSENPPDAATDVSVFTSELSFHIEDPDGDPMDYIVTTIPDVGSATVSGVGDGTYTVPVSGLAAGTTYHWFVDVSDGSTSSMREFTFTTKMGLPEITNESPEDGATGVPLGTTLCADITDEMGSPLAWEIQLLVGDVWQIVNSGVLPDGNGTVCASTDGLVNEYHERYTWRVQVFDSFNGLLVGKEFGFKTENAELCFNIEKLKIKRKADTCHIFEYRNRCSCYWWWGWNRCWDDDYRGAIEIKGTFDPSMKTNLRYADVIYMVRDGHGHQYTFTIPAGSFRRYGCCSSEVYRYRSPNCTSPVIDARFDFRNCEFTFRAKKVRDTDDIVGTTITVKMAIAQFMASTTVEGHLVGNDIVYENTDGGSCCPSQNDGKDCRFNQWYSFCWFWSWR